jgi:glycosyltransferase involved in cell wall biosynthesis
MGVISFDVLYLNSFFSFYFSMLPLMINELSGQKASRSVIAPRGELTRGALSLKPKKKKIFLGAARSSPPYRRVMWHATSEFEKNEISQIVGPTAQIRVIPNLATSIKCKPGGRPAKHRGIVRVVFLARISRKKNLDFALRLLDGLKGQVFFDIYGPIQDPGYWERCVRIIGALPGNVRVAYGGVVPHERVGEVLGRYDVYLLPTLSENYGHTIVEAMCAGCAVVISDQTPWRNLQALRAGFDLDLNDPTLFREALQQMVDMDEGEFASWSRNAAQHGLRVMAEERSIAQYRKLFSAPTEF